MSLFDSADNRSSSSTSSSTSFKNSVSPWLYNPYISIPVTCGSVLGLSLFYRRFFRRIPSAEFITPRTISRRKAIRGYVTSVGDGDGFRLYHTPGILLLPRLWKVPRDKKQLKDQTISIRLAGVDAPELAHFGKPAQPFAAEALDFLTNMLLNRHVKVDMLAKDHYGRIVAAVYVRKPFWWPVRKNVSLEMAKAGLATVYTNTGAEYGKLGYARLEAAEAKAKRKKKGMWSLKPKDYESPSDYKKRTAGG